MKKWYAAAFLAIVAIGIACCYRYAMPTSVIAITSGVCDRATTQQSRACPEAPTQPHGLFVGATTCRLEEDVRVFETPLDGVGKGLCRERPKTSCSCGFVLRKSDQ